MARESALAGARVVVLEGLAEPTELAEALGLLSRYMEMPAIAALSLASLLAW